MNRKRLHFDGRQVVLLEEELPPPGPGHVRIRSEWTQVSIGTEVAWMQERAPQEKEAVLGYSHVGIVEELGPEVTGVSPGERVLTLASHASAVNVSAGIGNLVPVPEGLAPDLATLGVLGSVAHHIVERAGVRLLESAAILGQGVVGSLILQLVRACGARPLIAIDLDAHRLAKARELGADHTVDASAGDAAAAVRDLTGGKGVSLCIEAAASAKVYETAIAILALRGRLVVSSAVFEPVSFRINQDLIHRELTIIGAHQPKCPATPNPYHPWTQPQNRLATLEAIRDGRLQVDHLISHRVKPEDGPAVYERLRAKDRTFVGVLFDWR